MDTRIMSGGEEGQDKLAVEEYSVYLKEYPDSPKSAQIRQSMAQLQAKSQ